MAQIWIQKAFSPFKRYLPQWLWNPVRSIITAFWTPILFSYRTGHFLSSFKMAAVSKKGQPLPWYTYPSIDFLTYRAYEDKIVLEFGGGQSTLWWAKRARHVVTLEGDEQWYEKIKHWMPENVSLYYVSMKSPADCICQVKEILAAEPYGSYDVIIIDGLYRYEMIEIADGQLAETGLIICDNAEGYGFYDGFREREFSRVDFFGNAPGVILPHCTSIYFKPFSFAFNSRYTIPVIAKES